MTNEEIAGMAVRLSMESGSFQDQLNQINREMKVVESNFKATGNTAKNFGDSIEGLEANWERANELLKLQNKAVQMYQERMDNARESLIRNAKEHNRLEESIKGTEQALDQAKGEYGANSEEVTKLEKELEDLQKALSKNEQLIRNSQKALDNSTVTYNNAVAKMKAYEKQIKDTENALDNFGKSLREVESVNVKTTSSIGVMQHAMGELVAEGIEMVVETMGEFIQQSFEYSEQMTKFHDMTGMSIESLGQYDAILQQTGGSLDTLTGSVMDFNERMYDAAQGTGDGAEIFDKLGISVIGARGKLRSTEEVLEETIYALQSWENQSEKTAMATTLLSTGAEELSGVLKMTNEELREMKDNIKVLSSDDIAKIQELNVQWKTFQQTVNIELMQALAKYSEDFGEHLDKIGKGVLGVIELLDRLHPYISKLKDYAQWLPTNWIPNMLASGFGWVYDTLTGAEKATDEATDSIKTDLENTAEVAKESFDEVGDSVAASMGNAQKEVEETMGVINSVLDDYYNDNLRDYEKYLNEKNGMDLEGRMKTAMELKGYEESQERQKEKQAKRYGDIYTQGLDQSNRAEIEKTRVVLNESNKRIEQYNKESEAFRNTNSGGYSNGNIPAYATGTQYHLGGLAIVGENGPELLTLPRGSKIDTTGQTNDIFQSSQVTNNNDTSRSITIQNVNVQAHDIRTLIKEIEDYSRLI